jgi:hypothetical protein
MEKLPGHKNVAQVDVETIMLPNLGMQLSGRLLC